MPIDINEEKDVAKIVRSSIGTKFSSKWGNLIVDLAVKSVRTVYRKEGEHVEIDQSQQNIRSTSTIRFCRQSTNSIEHREKNICYRSFEKTQC